MAEVQDGGVVGDTKKSVGLGTADPPLSLEVPGVLLFTREAQPTSIWNPDIWRHGVGFASSTGVAAERQSIALINPVSSGGSIRVHRTIVVDIQTGNHNWEIREGPITQFVSPANTDWTDFQRPGDPVAVVDFISAAGGVITGSQVRELRRTTDEVVVISIETPYVLHPAQALIVNATADDVDFNVSYWFEQFQSQSQF